MLLLSIILLPLLAAVLLALLGSDRSMARWVALLTATGTLLLSLGLASQLYAVREGRVAIANDNVVNGPVQPKIEWRRTWMTLGMLSKTVINKTELISVEEETEEGFPARAIAVDFPGSVTVPVRLEFYLG